MGEEAKDHPVKVAGVRGDLDVALLDARATFDRLIKGYAPSPAAANRIYQNRFYRDLAGNLAGILEYMAVERLFEVESEGKYDRVIHNPTHPAGTRLPRGPRPHRGLPRQRGGEDRAGALVGGGGRAGGAAAAARGQGRRGDRRPPSNT